MLRVNNLVGFGKGAVSEASAPTTWNPSDKHAGLTLSGGNLIATHTGADAHNSLRAIASASTGKKYWEITADLVSSNHSIGIGDAGAALTSYTGFSLYSHGWAPDGVVRYNNGTLASIQAYVTGDVCCFAVDIPNLKMWFRTNGGDWNNSATADPATNTEGIAINASTPLPIYPMASIFTQNDYFTANFGGSAYAQTPPSGFGNW